MNELRAIWLHKNIQQGGEPNSVELRNCDEQNIKDYNLTNDDSNNNNESLTKCQSQVPQCEQNARANQTEQNARSS